MITATMMAMTDMTLGAVFALVLVVVCLALWLFELVPPFVPTLLLVAGAPLLLGAHDVDLARVLAAAAHPVMALFFGGFVLAAAARRHGLDARLLTLVVRATRGRRRRLIVGLTLLSAFLSMWMSNVAAAALLVQLVRPLVGGAGVGGTGVGGTGVGGAGVGGAGVGGAGVGGAGVGGAGVGGAGDDDEAQALDRRRFGRAALLAVAFGANLGGIATPIGTGPNAIAIAATAVPISFARWMSFGLPLTILLLVVVVAVLLLGFRVRGAFTVAPAVSEQGQAPVTRSARRATVAVVAVFVAVVAAWLTGPLHGVDAAVVAVAAAAVLFATRLLGKDELVGLDWSTLFLIGGGLVLGEVLEAIGVLDRFRDAAASLPAGPAIVVVVIGATLLAAVMSNTATATLLVPLALSIDPSPATAVLVAVACSLGAPFVVSTPPNAMVAGVPLAAGGHVTSRDLLAVGLPVMVVGVVVVVATGPWALRAVFGLGAP